MKKILVMILLFAALQNSLAQDGEDVGWVSRFGAAIGVSPAMVFPNLDPVNIQVKNMGLENLSTNGVFVYGINGFAYIMLLDNVRIGGLGFSGSQKSTGTVDGFNKEVKYNYGIGGVTIEYSLPFIKNIAVSIGTIIGVGSASIEIFQNQNNFNWDEIWKNVSDKTNTTQNIYRKLSNTFFTITPTLNIDIPLSRFMAVRVGGGYVTSFSNSWKVDNEQDVKSTPSNLSSNAFFIQTGVYFGLIAF